MSVHMSSYVASTSAQQLAKSPTLKKPRMLMLKAGDRTFAVKNSGSVQQILSEAIKHFNLSSSYTPSHFILKSSLFDEENVELGDAALEWLEHKAIVQMIVQETSTPQGLTVKPEKATPSPCEHSKNLGSQVEQTQSQADSETQSPTAGISTRVLSPDQDPHPQRKGKGKGRPQTQGNHSASKGSIPKQSRSRVPQSSPPSLGSNASGSTRRSSRNSAARQQTQSVPTEEVQSPSPSLVKNNTQQQPVLGSSSFTNRKRKNSTPSNDDEDERSGKRKASRAEAARERGTLPPAEKYHLPRPENHRASGNQRPEPIEIQKKSLIGWGIENWSMVTGVAAPVDEDFKALEPLESHDFFYWIQVHLVDGGLREYPSYLFEPAQRPKLISDIKKLIQYFKTGDDSIAGFKAKTRTWEKCYRNLENVGAGQILLYETSRSSPKHVYVLDLIGDELPSQDDGEDSLDRDCKVVTTACTPDDLQLCKLLLEDAIHHFNKDLPDRAQTWRNQDDQEEFIHYKPNSLDSPDCEIVGAERYL